MAKPKLKSKTVSFALALGALGVIETNFHLLRDLLGDWYGVSFIAVSLATYYLRTITREPLA
jgi:hypothetical protein